MLTAIKNILWEAKLDIGNWAYLLIIFQMPIYWTLKVFGIHNKTYEMENHHESD